MNVIFENRFAQRSSLDVKHYDTEIAAAEFFDWIT